MRRARTLTSEPGDTRREWQIGPPERGHGSGPSEGSNLVTDVTRLTRDMSMGMLQPGLREQRPLSPNILMEEVQPPCKRTTLKPRDPKTRDRDLPAVPAMAPGMRGKPPSHQVLNTRHSKATINILIGLTAHVWPKSLECVFTYI